MGRGTKVIVTAAVAGVVGLGVLVNTLINRSNTKHQPEHKSVGLISNLTNSIESMSDVGFGLHMDPSIETAYSAHTTSVETIYYLWRCRGLPLDDKKLLVNQYLADSDYIIDGLKKVKGHDEYMRFYTQSIEYQMDIARAMIDTSKEIKEAMNYRRLLWENFVMKEREGLLQLALTKYAENQ